MAPIHWHFLGCTRQPPTFEWIHIKHHFEARVSPAVHSNPKTTQPSGITLTRPYNYILIKYFLDTLLLSDIGKRLKASGIQCGAATLSTLPQTSCKVTKLISNPCPAFTLLNLDTVRTLSQLLPILWSQEPYITLDTQSTEDLFVSSHNIDSSLLYRVVRFKYLGSVIASTCATDLWRRHELTRSHQRAQKATHAWDSTSLRNK